MKKFILKSATYVCVVVLFATTFSATSCKKNKMCHGNITVVDTAGHTVAGAIVVASYGNTSTSNQTNGSGVAEIDLKLPAILNIIATKYSDYPGMTGKGILRLDEPGKNTDVTITIKP